MASVKIAFYGQPEFTEVLRQMQDDFGEKDQKKILILNNVSCLFL